MDEEKGILEGFFTDMVQNMFIEACGNCKLYNKSEMYLYNTKTGENPNKGSAYKLKQDISKDVDVSFPIYGQSEKSTYIDNSVFLQLVDSPGCALIVRDGKDMLEQLNSLIISVVHVWPLLIISYAIATVCGTLIWLSVSYIT